MSATRRQKIEAMLAAEPDDVFLRYSLALELEAEGAWEAGLEILESLAHADPPYVPAFQMAAQHLVKRSRTEEARACLRQGIEAARTQGLSHAASEMAEALMDLGRDPGA